MEKAKGTEKTQEATKHEDLKTFSQFCLKNCFQHNFPKRLPPTATLQKTRRQNYLYYRCYRSTFLVVVNTARCDIHDFFVVNVSVAFTSQMRDDAVELFR